MLGITAGDGVGRRQLADAERRDQGRHPPQPAISVRGVTGVEFIRATDPPHARMGDNVVKEFQLIVAGDPEDLGHPEFSKSIQQVVTNGVASFEDSVHPVDGSTASRGGLCPRGIEWRCTTPTLKACPASTSAKSCTPRSGLCVSIAPGTPPATRAADRRRHRPRDCAWTCLQMAPAPSRADVVRSAICLEPRSANARCRGVPDPLRTRCGFRAVRRRRTGTQAGADPGPCSG